MDGNIHPASCLLHFEDVAILKSIIWNLIIMHNGAKKQQQPIYKNKYVL